MNSPVARMSREHKLAAWMSCFSVLESIQWLIIISLILSFIPLHNSLLSQQLLAMDIKDLKPEREMTLFRLFVVMAIGIQTVLVVLSKIRSDAQMTVACLQNRIKVSLAILAVQSYFIVMMWVYQPAWAQAGLIAVCALSLAEKIDAVLFRSSAVLALRRFILDHARPLAGWGNAAVVLLIASIVYVPDIKTVLSNAFLQDHFYHFDSFYMSPGWAFLTGNTLNVDVFSLYSIVSPVVMARLASWAGGFDYPQVMALLINICLMYYIGYYFFLRRWLNNPALAVLGIILILKWQMFHFGVSPIIWRFPSATPIRYILDIVLFSLLLAHVRQGRPVFLWAAAVVTGFALAYMIDAGIYLMGAFWVYAVMAAWVNGALTQGRVKPFVSLACLMALPVLLAVGLWGLLYGQAILKPSFWAHTVEYARFFIGGFGSLPVHEYLKDKELWAFVQGMAVPVVYTATLVYVGTLVFLRVIPKDNILVIALCVYGLGIFHYFVNRSAMTSYNVVIIPFVLVICFWLNKFFRKIDASRAKVIQWWLAAGACFLLMTNEYCVGYPNALNLSGKDWGADKAAYARGSDFSKDVGLIQSLTLPGDKVALVSSYATKLLIDAKRKPYFYYDPLIASRPMESLNFAGGTYIHTKEALVMTIQEFQQKKPELVFVESKLFTGAVGQAYYQAYEILGFLAVYLRQNYTPIQQGQYLMALKRN